MEQVSLIKTGWIVAPNSKQARLVTIYIKTRS